LDEDGKDKEYTSGNIVVVSQRYPRFVALADDIDKSNLEDGKVTFKVEGRYSKRPYMTITYEYEDPNNLTGTALLESNPIGNRWTGRWYGFTKDEDKKFDGGRVVWERRPDNRSNR
jgi:hypothetical protein